MSTQENVLTSRRVLEECFNEGDLDLLDQCCTPNVVQHDPATQGDLRGPAALKDQIRVYRDGMSDLEMKIDDIFAIDDKVVIRWSGEGTNDGEMMGMPPTGRRAAVTGITIDRYDSGGRITEIWSQWDNLGFIQQLGVAEQAMAAAQQR
jgi:steroid delta-isomerase-like uncharacterized protein